jgi:LuxR family maltose regulon positive regulatory protein
MADVDITILLTKLHRPSVTSSLIERPLLYDQLNKGMHSPLTLVLASAGFGKTSFSTWLERMAAGQFSSTVSLPSAWLSLDEADSDIHIFIRYLIAALRTIFADACPESLMLLQATQQPPLVLLYATLSNEIEQLPGDFILVLMIPHHPRHRGTMTCSILGATVPNHTKDLVLISRISPPLPLATLRAKGLTSEIRTRDLRFAAEETAAYLHQAQVPLLSQPILDLLIQRFEGWIAGLHMAAISLRYADSQINRSVRFIWRRCKHYCIPGG